MSRSDNGAPGFRGLRCVSGDGVKIDSAGTWNRKPAGRCHFPSHRRRIPQPRYDPPSLRASARWYAGRWIIGLGALLIGLFIGIGAGSGGAKPVTKTVAEPGPTVTETTGPTVTEAVPSGVKTVTVTGRPVVATHYRTQTVTDTPPPKAGFSDGTYLVGTDIKPGLYRTEGHGDGSSFAGCASTRTAQSRWVGRTQQAQGFQDAPRVVVLVRTMGVAARVWTAPAAVRERG